MDKCSRCGKIISDNDIMAWKCMECGKAFKVNLSKLKKLQIFKDKPENVGKALLKCPNCGKGIDKGNCLQMLCMWKCHGRNFDGFYFNRKTRGRT